MTRKFLFCFPLRVGNIIFGYVIIFLAIAVVAFHLHELVQHILMDYREAEKFRNFQYLEKIMGASRNTLVVSMILAYYLSYVIIGTLFFFFGIILICGAYKANYCLVATFFTYSFFHLFLTIVLVAWESVTNGWVQFGLILLSDLLLIICLFSVKYLMEAIRTGNIYSRPSEEYLS